jgi:hypothetical protein
MTGTASGSAPRREEIGEPGQLCRGGVSPPNEIRQFSLGAERQSLRESLNSLPLDGGGLGWG